MKRKIWVKILLAMLISSLLLAGCNGQPAANSGTNTVSAPQTEPTTRTVTDAYGRNVVIPAKIERILPVYSYSVVSSFLHLFGEGDKIACGLPTSFSPDTYKYLPIFAPQVSNLPSLTNSTSDTPNFEAMLNLNPDLCFAVTEAQVQALEEKNFTTVGLSIRHYEEFRNNIRVLGDVFDKQDIATRYLKYLEDTLAMIKERVDTIPEEERVRVLYFDKQRMCRPNVIGEWWITAAGGVSVTADQGEKAVEMNLESIISKNPDVIIEMLHSNAIDIYADKDWAGIKAVQDKRVYSVPVGSHFLSNWTSEEPIFMIWVATKFYPELFSDINVVEEFKNFYKEYFNYELTTEQAEDIITSDRDYYARRP